MPNWDWQTLDRPTPTPPAHKPDWHTRAYLAMFAIVAGFLLTVAGFAAGRNNHIPVDGHTGEVYVADTGQWVAAGNHSAHEGER
jgi:hypothetical protein